MLDAAGAGEGREIDPDLQKHEKHDIKIVFFHMFEGLGRFRGLPQPQRHQAKLPKALPRPKNLTKTPKTQKPEKPLRRGNLDGTEGGQHTVFDDPLPS